MGTYEISTHPGSVRLSQEFGLIIQNYTHLLNKTKLLYKYFYFLYINYFYNFSIAPGYKNYGGAQNNWTMSSLRIRNMIFWSDLEFLEVVLSNSKDGKHGRIFSLQTVTTTNGFGYLHN